MRKDLLERKNDILAWISEHQSNAFICRQLNCKADTLKRFYKSQGIEYSGNMGGKGIKHDAKRKNAIEYAKDDGRLIKSWMLKNKLIEDGLKEEKCELCGCGPVWMDKRLPLELHHIDGNHYNNSFDNLQILCPNCHAIQPGNSGANIN